MLTPPFSSFLKYSIKDIPGMKYLLFFGFIFFPASCYLNFPVLHFDRRFENEQGKVNPFRLARRLFRVSSQLVFFLFFSTSTITFHMTLIIMKPGNKWRKYYTRTYLLILLYISSIFLKTRIQAKVESLFTAVSTVINQTLAGFQEMYVGNCIDSLNLLGTKKRSMVKLKLVWTLVVFPVIDHLSRHSPFWISRKDVHGRSLQP